MSTFIHYLIITSDNILEGAAILIFLGTIATFIGVVFRICCMVDSDMRDEIARSTYKILVKLHNIVIIVTVISVVIEIFLPTSHQLMELLK